MKQTLGVLLTEQGRYAEADRTLSEVLDEWHARAGPGQPMAIIVRVQRGESRLTSGRLRDALADFREAEMSARRAFGPAHPFVALGIRGAARVAAEREQRDSAEAGFRRALAAFGPNMRPNHHYVLGTRRSLAEVLGNQGRHAEADSLLRDVLIVLRVAMAKGHVEVGRALHAHGEVRMRMGDAAGAETLLREALSIRRAALGPDHWQVAETEGVLGAALAAQARHSEAGPLMTNAYERLLAERGTSDRRTRDARARLGR